MAHIVAQLPAPFTSSRRQREPYKEPGDPVAIGDTVGMIEVMKHFIGEGRIAGTFSAYLAEDAARSRLASRLRMSPDMAIERLFIANRGGNRRSDQSRPPGIGDHDDSGLSGVKQGHDGRPHFRTKPSVSVRPSQRNPIWTSGRWLRRRRRPGPMRVHPGYGFLSERREFARAVEAAGHLSSSDPSGDTIERMGDKVAASGCRSGWRAGRAGSKGGSIPSIRPPRWREKVNYRGRLIKAAAGGGGHGIPLRQYRSRELHAGAPGAGRGGGGFGDGGLYIERSIPSPRHIGVQIVGDSTRAVHFFERNARSSVAGRRCVGGGRADRLDP